MPEKVIGNDSIIDKRLQIAVYRLAGRIFLRKRYVFERGFYAASQIKRDVGNLLPSVAVRSFCFSLNIYVRPVFGKRNGYGIFFTDFETGAAVRAFDNIGLAAKIGRVAVENKPVIGFKGDKARLIDKIRSKFARFAEVTKKTSSG